MVEKISAFERNRTFLVSKLVLFYLILLTLKVPETKTAEFANSIDLDEVAHFEPPHPDLHCLPSHL